MWYNKRSLVSIYTVGLVLRQLIEGLKWAAVEKSADMEERCQTDVMSELEKSVVQEDLKKDFESVLPNP